MKNIIFTWKNHVFVILCSPIRERGVEKTSFYRKKTRFYQNIDFALQIPFRDAGVLDFRSKNVHFSWKKLIFQRKVMFFDFFLNAICERTLAKSFIFHDIFVFFVLFFSPKDTPEPLKRRAKTRSFSRRRCIFWRSVCAFFWCFFMTFQVLILL